MLSRFFTWQLHKGHIAEPPKYVTPEDDEEIEQRELGAAKEPLLNRDKIKEFVTVVMSNEIKTDILTDEEGYGQNVIKNKHRGQGFDIKGQNGKRKITLWKAKRETRNVETKRTQNKDSTTITASKVYRATITIDVLRRPEEAVTKEFRARVKKMINASGSDYQNMVYKLKEDYGELIFTRIVVGGLFSDERKMVTQMEKSSDLDRKDIASSAMTTASGAGEKDVNNNVENNLRNIEQKNVVVGGIPSHSQGRYLWSRSVYREDVEYWEIIDILESIPIERLIERVKAIELEAQRLELLKPKCQSFNRSMKVS
ncbi:UNVERIFIED_CONTAM: hypothetical protein HDU68_010619 [Siphonaria sp. JEL0065]|nr:hypothetical protein HDU68_010619 [Siphonaria sp. JEL0065]